MGTIKVIRETLEDKSFRYALLCDGHVIDFRKESQEYNHAGVHKNAKDEFRIFALIGSGESFVADDNLMIVEIEKQ